MLEIKPNPRAKRIEAQFPTLSRRFPRGIRVGAHNAGETVVRRVRKILNTGNRTGVKYRRLPHRSSAPGEPPRSQSGRLAKSADYVVTGSKEVMVKESKIGKFLEDGTRKMHPRPHLILAINLEERNVENYLQKGPEKAIRI